MTGRRDSPTVHVIGNVNVDLIMGPLPPWPAPGTENILPQSELRVGGAAGNVALALRALGVPYRLVCNVGDDLFGRWLAKAFGDAGRGWPVSPVATTISVGVSHPNGERTFLTTHGHLAEMTLADALRRLPARVGRGDVALLLGAFLSPRLLDSYESLIGILAARGFAIALDTGWPSEGWTDAIRRRTTAWLGSCDHVLLNEIESCALAGCERVEEAGERLRRMAKSDCAIVVKQGAAGATAWQGSRRVRVPARRVTVIDTIGAGDAFDAGYLAALMAGRSLRDAVAEGVAVASAAISTSPRAYRPADARRGGSRPILPHAEQERKRPAGE